MGVVVVSTVVFILSTMPELTDDIDLILDFNFNKSSTGASPEGPSKEAPRALPGDQGRELIGATELGIAIAGAEAETAAFDRRKQVARCLGSQQVGTG